MNLKLLLTISIITLLKVVTNSYVYIGGVS
jgi:hypothetical protein